MRHTVTGIEYLFIELIKDAGKFLVEFLVSVARVSDAHLAISRVVNHHGANSENRLAKVCTVSWGQVAPAKQAFFNSFHG